MKITSQVNITLASGQTATHTAELLGVRHEGDGACVAVAACCGLVGSSRTCTGCSGSGCSVCHGKGSIKDEDTRSSHAFYDIATMGQDEISREIQQHVDRVAKHHAGAHKSKDFIAALTIPETATVAGSGKVG